MDKLKCAIITRGLKHGSRHGNQGYGNKKMLSARLELLLHDVTANSQGIMGLQFKKLAGS